jgi:CMP/dCMP kinase
MIITISGNLGSGKSTVAKIIAKKLGLKHYSTGDFQREVAKEKGLTIFELNKFEETDKSIDKMIDERAAKIGETEDDVIIDSRLAFHFIPHSVKIFLDVDPKIGAERIFNDKRDDEKENTNIEATAKTIRERQKSETKRWFKYYGVHYLDLKHYDLVIDTSSISQQEVAENILEYLTQHKT